MALIKCPECGKEISDKTPACIHCGCPINKQNIISYNVIYKGFESTWLQNTKGPKAIVELTRILEIDFSPSFDIINNPPQTIEIGLSKENAEWFVSKLKPYGCIIEVEQSCKPINDNCNKKYDIKSGRILVCPRCGSQNITTGARGYSIVTGFIGSGQTVNRCASCGCRWHPNN